MPSAKPEGDDGAWFLTLDGVRIPFRMEHDLDGDRPGDEAVASWMILLPVTVRVTLPY